MGIFLIGIGGALGSLARYSLGKCINKLHTSYFPFATMFINITGAVLLGVVSALHRNNTLYLFAVEGFLGAFTTFSTFMYEGFQLIRNNKVLDMALYVFATLMLGVIGYTLGFYLGT